MSFGGGFLGNFPSGGSSKKPSSRAVSAAAAPPPPKNLLIPQKRSISIGIPQFHVVILSASSRNIRDCLRELFKNEPSLIDRIIIIDDGCREGLGGLPGVVWINGQKPFIFARNANLGIKRAPYDVVLMNDDAILKTPNGLMLLAQAVHERPIVGICSAGITGHVGNENQYNQKRKGVLEETRKLSFVCVYITRSLINKVGLLDERFVGYGYEDDDYCKRAQKVGSTMGIFDGCVINHGDVPSTFRALPKYPELLSKNRLLFKEKWKNDSLK